MSEPARTMRINRSYLTIAILILFLAGSGYTLLQTIHARGPKSYVLLLALLTLLFFFVTLLCIFQPYLRVDEDRIIVSHDLLRKDVLFFYDITRIEFGENKSICVYHLNGLTRVVFSKFKASDKAKVIAFFQQLAAQQDLSATIHSGG
jgi:Na+-driven multidrug efflux pump